MNATNAKCMLYGKPKIRKEIHKQSTNRNTRSVSLMCWRRIKKHVKRISYGILPKKGLKKMSFLNV